MAHWHSDTLPTCHAPAAILRAFASLRLRFALVEHDTTGEVRLGNQMHALRVLVTSKGHHGFDLRFTADQARPTQRFLVEARATMELTHERIMRTYNVFQEGGDYLARGSLEDLLRVRGSLPRAKGNQYMLQAKVQA